MGCKSKRINLNWSEYKDSNLGPPGPKPGALPSCAILRKLAKVNGFEPLILDLESNVLPLTPHPYKKAPNKLMLRACINITFV